MSERDIPEIMRLLGTAIKAISEVKTDIAEFKTESKANMAEVKAGISNVKSDIAEFKIEVNQRFDKVEEKLIKITTQNKIMNHDILELRVENERIEKRVDEVERKVA